ncbi:MAG: ABC transporter permease [candidate division WOR-3 bacterium]
MMRFIINIIVKEVKEFLTLQLLAPFIAIMIIFIFIGRATRGEREKAKAPQRIMVVNNDRSAPARTIIEILKSQNFIVSESNAEKEDALTIAKSEEIPLVLVIPEGLSQTIENFQTGTIEIYNLIRGFSATQAMKTVKIKTVLQEINSRFAETHIAKFNPEIKPENIILPIKVREYVMLKDRIAEGNPQMLQGLVISQIFMVPIILLMTIIYVSQLIAASIGQEKENKTLETLLTVPINRIYIVVGKMLGAVAVALIITTLFLVAFGYYMRGFSDIPEAAGKIDLSLIDKLGLGLRPDSILLITISLFLAILCALSLSTLLAIFTEDAKTAQAALTPLMVLCLVPYFFTLLFDIETASMFVKIVVYLIPFSYPFLTPKAIIFGNYGIIISGFIYMAIFSCITIYIAARIFQTDRILTTKLRFRKREGKQGV